MKATKNNIDCANLILNRNNLDPRTWTSLRNDIALTITIAENEMKKKVKKKEMRNDN